MTRRTQAGAPPATQPDGPTSFRFGSFLYDLALSEAELRERLREGFDLRELATALSRVSRFGGNASGFVSVAQHSVLVASIARMLAPVDTGAVRLALYHDAHEAITGDVPTPIKRVVGSPWTRFEAKIELALREVLELPTDPTAESIVKTADTIAFRLEDRRWRKGWSVEAAAAQSFGEAYDVSVAVLALLERDMSPEEARSAFLAAAGALA